MRERQVELTNEFLGSMKICRGIFQGDLLFIFILVLRYAFEFVSNIRTTPSVVFFLSQYFNYIFSEFDIINN